jgi:hypothetical protein
LFAYNKNGTIIYLLVYVDDIVVMSSSPNAVMALLQDLRSDFALKNLGDLHYFMGIQVTKQSDGSQEKYAAEVLHRVGMHNCKSVKTPLATSEKLSAGVGIPLNEEESSKYRSLVGGLQYWTLTCPNISFVVNKVCRFLHAPTQVHMVAVKRILRYLQDTMSVGLKFHCSSSLKPSAFSDGN